MLSSPPKIKSVSIVDNPFPDIIPRITAAEKRAQQRAREAAQREREEAERRKGAKKLVPRICTIMPMIDAQVTFQERKTVELWGRRGCGDRGCGGSCMEEERYGAA